MFNGGKGTNNIRSFIFSFAESGCLPPFPGIVEDVSAHDFIFSDVPDDPFVKAFLPLEFLFGIILADNLAACGLIGTDNGGKGTFFRGNLIRVSFRFHCMSDDDKTVDVVGHDHERAEFDKREMGRDFFPRLISDFAQRG